MDNNLCIEECAETASGYEVWKSVARSLEVSDHKIIFLRIWTNEQFYKSYPETVYGFEL